MIKCLAIDDEPLALQQLVAYIGKIPYLELAGSCSSADEARKLMEKTAVDAIFVDINMPDESGLDFVKSLDELPIVVFTTAYENYAVESYKVNAVDYLLKPFGLTEFNAAAVKVRRRYEALNVSTVSQVDEDDAIFVKSDYKVVRIAIGSISYIEAMSEYLRIHSDEIDRPLVVLLSMKKMEEHLPTKKFMRVHRSYIINLRRIREVAKSHITLTDGTVVPMGDMYKENFNAYLSGKFLTK